MMNGTWEKTDREKKEGVWTEHKEFWELSVWTPGDSMHLRGGVSYRREREGDWITGRRSKGQSGRKQLSAQLKENRLHVQHRQVPLGKQKGVKSAKGGGKVVIAEVGREKSSRA